MPGWYAYNHTLEMMIRSGITNADFPEQPPKMRSRSNTCF